MAKGNAIAAAVLAAAGNPGTGGSGPSGQGALSPLVASYSQSYSANRPYSPLPRPAPVFLNGAFGPFDPVTAMPIDPPREDTGRPDPRRFQYPVGWNLPVGQPGTEGIKLTSFQVLRSLADTYSVARACIDKRKSEIIGLEWDIIPTDEAEHALMDDDKARADWEKRRAVVKEFFSHPDSDRSKYPTFGAWLNAILEDRFVIDAVAIHLVPPRKKGAGPFGSDLASLDVLDGSLIRPMLSTLGATPRPPAPGFQEYAWGVPRVDLMSVITDADADELSEPVAGFRADQLIYMRDTPRDWTPYGFSPVEKALLPISIGLSRQQYQNEYFASGSIPAIFLTPGPDISTPQQIRQLQDALNARAGDIGAKQQVIVLPPGSKADPQKPFPLADQFDEWIISQVAMPFGLTPMDLGVTPRVSAVQTPSESRELSQINSDKGSQHRVEPVCNDLKAVLFDFVIQKVFKQEDMQFSWGLKDRGKNRQSLIDQGTTLTQGGVQTIDEFRLDLGMTPFGLPETSVPLVFTATGPVPLQAVASEHAPLPGQPAALPAAQQPAGPGQPPQVTDGELTTPAHEAARQLPETPGGPGKPGGGKDGAPEPEKAAKQAAELQILARHVRKGRDLAGFRAQWLPAEAVDAARRALPESAEAAVKAARAVTEARRRQERRDRHVDAQAAIITARLGKLVSAHRNGKMSLPQVIDTAVGVMGSGYQAVMDAGTQDASGDYEDTPRQPQAQAAQSAAEGQRGFFTGLLQDIIGGLSVAAITARLGLFAATLRRAYNQAYGTTVTTAHPDYYVVWELGDSRDHCALCVARDGKRFKLGDLPGWPGDGGFGPQDGPGGQAAICLGGPRCHCSCSLVQGDQAQATGANTQLPWSQDYYAAQDAQITSARQQAAAARRAFVDSLPAGPALRAMTRDQLRRQVADLANQRIRLAGGYPGVSVEPQDVPAALIAQMLPPGMEGAAGLSDPRLDVPQAVERMFAARMSRLDMTKGELIAIVRGVLADIGKAAGPYGPPADPEAVYRQLARNYRPEGIAWVREVPWHGPAEVPLDMIHDGSQGSWAASEPGANSEHVARFARRITAGQDVHPVILVRVPGHGKLRLVDGHHRFLGARQAGRETVEAYTGLVGDDSPQAPWALTHVYQVHSGGDPLNKAAAEDPSRVAFLLLRAPNEAGKPRFLLQKRDDASPHGGTWGLPGGKCHEGEPPWDAAVREASEELGDLPAVKPAASWSRAAGDHVVLTYLADLPAMFTPSADGKTAGETAGWGWFRRKDVDGLPLHPAMRDTWEALDFGDDLLGGKAAAVKGAGMEAFQDRGDAARRAAGINGTAGDAQDAPHPFTPDRGGDPQACTACGLSRLAGPHGTAGCGCCGGSGEHPTGHECYRCDASGYLEGAEQERPDCEEAFRDPAVHAAGCPHCGAVKAAGYSVDPRSCMISLDLPEGLIEPVPGGTEDHHITIVYCGKVGDAEFTEICRRAQEAASATPGPLAGVISGLGTFPPSASSDGKVPVWAGVTLPGAEGLRAALGDLSASEHAGWHPHVTRMYADDEASLPAPLPPVPVTFTHLSVHHGDGKVVRYPLGGAP